MGPRCCGVPQRLLHRGVAVKARKARCERGRQTASCPADFEVEPRCMVIPDRTLGVEPKVAFYPLGVSTFEQDICPKLSAQR